MVFSVKSRKSEVSFSRHHGKRQCDVPDGLKHDMVAHNGGRLFHKLLSREFAQCF